MGSSGLWREVKIDASARQCSEWKRRNEDLGAGEEVANEPEKESDAWGAWVLGYLDA